MDMELEIEALQLLGPADASLYDGGGLDPATCGITCDGPTCKATCGATCTVTG
ncbi:hypothetical protein ACFYXF_11475 [Streptomyces sp. NPDC002680]|uniref:hypothetical protein n=1 Tax=Streptomyces sp. NPDC002680 TaxID=3364659 RepID=UPI003681D888